MNLSWENLCKFFVWAKKEGMDNVYVYDGERASTIDGSVRREDLDRFIAEQKQSSCKHDWTDISNHSLEPSKKLEWCLVCGTRRTVSR